MKITIFGATGGTGTLFARYACEAGHEVTAVVRDPSRMTYQSPRLEVVRADVMDASAIGRAIAGRDVIASAIGTRSVRMPTTVQTDSTTAIIRAMRENDARRLIVVSNSGMIIDNDGPVSRWVAKPILRRVLRHTWADMRMMERLVRDSDLHWTIVRPPRLTNGRRTTTYRTAVNHNVRGGIRASRADLADLLLRCLDDTATIHTAVAIGN